ncbi:MAG: DUF2256 domain-containing protein [Geminicoccaceae bacterium]
MHRKPHLPTKTCPACGRPFTWRKRWARVWDAVVWCSERCRRRGCRAARPEATARPLAAAQPMSSPPNPAAATAPPPSRGRSGRAQRRAASPSPTPAR